MPTFPVRRLGSAGIVPDVNPEDLENVSVFTGGVNVRFKNGRVSRAPVYRTVSSLTHEPGHLLAVPPSSSGYEEVISVAYDFASMLRLNGATLEDVTPEDQVGVDGSETITSGFLGGVTYLNRETHHPLCKRPSDSTFVNLPNWPTNDRAKVIRPYKDQLIALGITKVGTYYPTMVRWSDFATFGAVPVSWDPGDPTKSAGENIINEMTHNIVDGMGLRDSFVLYCTSSVWLMDYVGGNDIYQFRKVFDEYGVINQNCIAQVGGLHYVFDRNDIYVHDGVSPKSICDDRTKRFIFDALNFAKAHLCFVEHDAKLTEVRFSYPADDRYTGFPNATTGCNRQAVYNYSNDTWTFYDAPNIVSCTKAALISGATWHDDMASPWEEYGGLWMTTEGDEDRHMLVASRTDTSQGLTAPRIYGHDLISGGRMALPVNPETLKPALLERTGIDLDAYGKNLSQYINVQQSWPQIRMDNPSDCHWQFGASDFVSAAPSWSSNFTFDPTIESKIDINEAGRYLGYRFYCGGQGDFDLSSFDLKVLIRGKRG